MALQAECGCDCDGSIGNKKERSEWTRCGAIIGEGCCRRCVWTSNFVIAAVRTRDFSAFIIQHTPREDLIESNQSLHHIYHICARITKDIYKIFIVVLNLGDLKRNKEPNIVYSLIRDLSLRH